MNRRIDWRRFFNLHLVFGPGLLVAFLVAAAYDLRAQTPNPVTPGYQVCSVADPGNTRCSFVPEFDCSNSAVVTVAAAATTQIVALTAEQRIRVCSFVITGDTAATVATFVYGTGTDCASGTTALTGAMRMADEGGISLSAARGALFSTIPSNALCLTAATGAVTGFVTYGKN